MATNFHRYRRERCATAPASGFYNFFSRSSDEAPETGFRKRIGPDFGYEVPFTNGKGLVPGTGGCTLDNKLQDTRTEEEVEKSGKMHFEQANGSGSLSERPFRPSIAIVQGPPDNKMEPWRRGKHLVPHIEESFNIPGKKWRLQKHRPTILDRNFPEEEAPTVRRPCRKPGACFHQPEWIPPFRSYVEGKTPTKFYAVFDRQKVKGKRKSTLYNHFETKIDRTWHYDENKRILGGRKCDYKKNDYQWPFTPLPPEQRRKHFASHAAHSEGVGTLLNPEKDHDYNAYIFL